MRKNLLLMIVLLFALNPPVIVVVAVESPIEIVPLFATANSVLEALLAISKALLVARVSAPQTESFEYGVVVPMPTLPPLGFITKL